MGYGKTPYGWKNAICQIPLPINLYSSFTLKMDMKWLKYGLAIPLIVFAVGLVLPGAAGLFFNPEGGFS
ncbi:MAG: hypothetical protein KAU14_06785, partial [Thermoplasmata archaeon]|nr:hypothetical protein [Thermoplasmata archaeon]